MEFIKEKLKKYWRWLFGLLIPVAFAATLLSDGECQNIKARLDNQSFEVRMAVKAQQIPRCVETGIYDDLEFGAKVHIQSIESIPNGIEVTARAWKSDSSPMNPTGSVSPVGFGKDGSVEWERFKIYNPPILVKNGTKRVVFDTIQEKNRLVDNYKEDISSAIKQSLAHTISITGKTGTSIIPGSVGHTVDIYYPDANPETTSVDGVVARTDVQGCASWASVRDGTGDTADDTTAINYFLILANDLGVDCSNPDWKRMDRGMLLFDSSLLPDNATISAATISIEGDAGTTVITPGYSQTVDLVLSTTAANTSLAASDYEGTVGNTTLQSDTQIAVASWNTAAYNDFPLNTTGIGNISKTGVSKFGIRGSGDRTNTAPTWALGRLFIGGKYAETAVTTSDPKLVITYTAPATGQIQIDDFINIGIIQ